MTSKPLRTMHIDNLCTSDGKEYVHTDVNFEQTGHVVQKAETFVEYEEERINAGRSENKDIYDGVKAGEDVKESELQSRGRSVYKEIGLNGEKNIDSEKENFDFEEHQESNKYSNDQLFRKKENADIISEHLPTVVEKDGRRLEKDYGVKVMNTILKKCKSQELDVIESQDPKVEDAVDNDKEKNICRTFPGEDAFSGNLVGCHQFDQHAYSEKLVEVDEKDDCREQNIWQYDEKTDRNEDECEWKTGEKMKSEDEIFTSKEMMDNDSTEDVDVKRLKSRKDSNNRFSRTQSERYRFQHLDKSQYIRDPEAEEKLKMNFDKNDEESREKIKDPVQESAVGTLHYETESHKYEIPQGIFESLEDSNQRYQGMETGEHVDEIKSYMREKSEHIKVLSEEDGGKDTRKLCISTKSAEQKRFGVTYIVKPGELIIQETDERIKTDEMNEADETGSDLVAEEKLDTDKDIAKTVDFSDIKEKSCRMKNELLMKAFTYVYLALEIVCPIFICFFFLVFISYGVYISQSGLNETPVNSKENAYSYKDASFEALNSINMGTDLKVLTVRCNGPTYVPPEADIPQSNLNENNDASINTTGNTNSSSANNTQEPRMFSLNDDDLLRHTEIRNDSLEQFISLRYSRGMDCIHNDGNRSTTSLSSFGSRSIQVNQAGVNDFSVESQYHHILFNGAIISPQDESCRTRQERQTFYFQFGTESSAILAGNENPNENIWFNLTEFSLMGREFQDGLADRDTRAQTFRYHCWPHTHLTPEEMADAGFYYTGIGDKTICFSCKKCLEDWKPGDVALVEHQRHYPDCSYMREQIRNLPHSQTEIQEFISRAERTRRDSERTRRDSERHFESLSGHRLPNEVPGRNGSSNGIGPFTRRLPNQSGEYGTWLSRRKRKDVNSDMRYDIQEDEQFDTGGENTQQKGLDPRKETSITPGYSETSTNTQVENLPLPDPANIAGSELQPSSPNWRSVTSQNATVVILYDRTRMQEETRSNRNVGNSNHRPGDCTRQCSCTMPSIDEILDLECGRRILNEGYRRSQVANAIDILLRSTINITEDDMLYDAIKTILMAQRAKPNTFNRPVTRRRK